MESSSPAPRAILALVLSHLSAASALAFEQPLFPLGPDQLKAYHAYQGERGQKAFAASPEGKIGVATGYISNMVAAREALKSCDAKGSGCILIDLDGQPVPLALQYAQGSRADSGVIEGPLSLRDLTLTPDVFSALEGYRDKPANKAFAISLKGPWARAWEAASPEVAEQEALNTCNKNDKAATAPCFILMTNDTLHPGSGLVANPDLSVTPAK